MKRTTKVARTYARALFDVAMESKKIGAVKGDLFSFQKLLYLSSDLKKVFEDYSLNFKEVASLIQEFSKKMKWQKETENFLLILLEKKRSSMFHDTLKEFEVLVDNHEGIIRPEITSAVELSEKLRKEVSQSLEKITNKKVEPVFLIDAHILGGMVTRMGSKVLDGSLKTQLETLLR